MCAGCQQKGGVETRNHGLEAPGSLQKSDDFLGEVCSKVLLGGGGGGGGGGHK